MLLHTALFSSCQQEKKETLLDSFTIERNLSHTVIEKDSFWKVNNIIKNGDHIILHEEDGSNNLSVYDLNERKIINRFGKRGNGPNELLSPPLSIIPLSEERIMWLDQNRKAVYEAIYSQPEPLFTKKLDLKEKGYYLFEIIPLVNHFYAGIGSIEEGRYMVLDSIGNKLSVWFDYPPDEQHAESMHKALAYQGGLIQHPDRTRFFFHCYDSEILEIVTIKEDGSLTKVNDVHYDYVSYVPQKDQRYISSAVKKESKACFISASATSNYIYLLYSGRVIGDGVFTAYRSNIIFVYDWEGNPVVRYNLDMDVNYISADENDKGIYGFSNDPETMLVYFELNNWTITD